MSRIIDLTGKTFGRLTVLGYGHYDGKYTFWKCQCACGSVLDAETYRLRNGRTKSCGCYRIDFCNNRLHKTTTGELRRQHPRIYRIWQCMKNRCRNPKRKDYSRYGGRGISVCDEWQHFPKFLEWSLSSGYRDDLTIDRIDVNRGYEPDNCQWLTRSENSKKAIADRRARHEI